MDAGNIEFVPEGNRLSSVRGHYHKAGTKLEELLLQALVRDQTDGEDTLLFKTLDKGPLLLGAGGRQHDGGTFQWPHEA